LRQIKNTFIIILLINNLKFLSKCPEYYYNQEIFNIKLFNESINNIKNCEQFPDFVIRENIIYLLNIYENAINSLLYEYKNNIKQYKKTDTYYQIRKKEINTKKIYLFEKQKLLDFKIILFLILSDENSL
jgi:hypothetical protein